MDWNDFAKRLTLELSRLPVQSFIIVQAPSGMPYVQAMRAEQGMDAEAVGSAFLPRPLGHLQERRLRSLGWEPPDDARRRNWWDHFDLREPGRRDKDGRAAAERLEACAMLAGRMVGAFRDVYGIDSPLELVYQAARIGKEGGPLALPGLGIPVAIPEGGERRAERPSGSALETALADARERGDQRGYLELLARATLYLPAPNNPGGTDHQYATAQFGDGTFILAFTSPEAMERSLQGQAVHHREESLARLARRWPNPRWQLAVNPGLPSASYLDANALFEPEHAEPPKPSRRERKPGRRRAAPAETPIDSVPAGPPQGSAPPAAGARTAPEAAPGAVGPFSTGSAPGEPGARERELHEGPGVRPTELRHGDERPAVTPSGAPDAFSTRWTPSEPGARAGEPATACARRRPALDRTRTYPGTTPATGSRPRAPNVPPTRHPAGPARPRPVHRARPAAPGREATTQARAGASHATTWATPPAATPTKARSAPRPARPTPARAARAPTAPVLPAPRLTTVPRKHARHTPGAPHQPGQPGSP
ncbi:SseB family protein [Actinomadura sp. WMMB 499]|uniref:SseB family protein n=1 Tax=Actinomadura sp. WMMB 499 TaxID=1219491 RepID=UPI001243A1FC|nr:SseB family protein [Actinomadura sp. WMMB 499]QFG21015.1 hypothetical protein F7P10_07525 [Actinomadura sp. WMMB 499]